MSAYDVCVKYTSPYRGSKIIVDKSREKNGTLIKTDMDESGNVLFTTTDTKCYDPAGLNL